MCLSFCSQALIVSDSVQVLVPYAACLCRRRCYGEQGWEVTLLRAWRCLHDKWNQGWKRLLAFVPACEWRMWKPEHNASLRLWKWGVIPQSADKPCLITSCCFTRVFHHLPRDCRFLSKLHLWPFTRPGHDSFRGIHSLESFDLFLFDAVCKQTNTNKKGKCSYQYWTIRFHLPFAHSSFQCERRVAVCFTALGASGQKQRRK